MLSRNLNVLNSLKILSISSRIKQNYTTETLPPVEEIKLPNRPITMKPDEKLTSFIESKEAFVHVQRLLPNLIVPDPPKHSSYPTPSGWQPPNLEKAKHLPYTVLRTRFHNLPMYVEERNGGTRKLVRIKNIHGDIWQLNSELKQYIKEQVKVDQNIDLNIYTSVNEVQGHILVKGLFQEYVCKFLLEKGF